MSTYIDPAHPNRHDPYTDIPDVVIRYLKYLETILNRSPRTVNAYYIDLRGFFRFLLGFRTHADTPWNELDVHELDLAFVRAITQEEIYEYLYYLTNECANKPAARARKLAAVKGLFRYLVRKENLLTYDPAEDISTPSIKRTLPKYLSLEESLELLNNIQSDFFERDYCIITLFLNCGMRLTELVTIDLSDFKEDTIRIVGKGNKERLVYLNNACKEALRRYCDARAALPNLTDKKALFVSAHTGKRLSNRRVEQIVERCLKTAGLSGRGYSPHKLRHTAATLMYRHGNVDMLALKEILGHEHVSTTEIYTHINTQQLKDAVSSSPLSRVKAAMVHRSDKELPEHQEESNLEDLDDNAKGTESEET